MVISISAPPSTPQILSFACSYRMICLLKQLHFVYYFQPSSSTMNNVLFPTEIHAWEHDQGELEKAHYCEYIPGIRTV